MRRIIRVADYLAWHPLQMRFFDETKKLVVISVTLLLLAACNEAPQIVEQPTAITKTTQSTPLVLAPHSGGKFCFIKRFKQDITTINLLLAGNQVTGDMRWAPHQKDGAVGVLVGTRLLNGEMQLVYDYMIEGSQQTETKIMKIENGVLWVKTGELEDPKFDGNLRYKDASKAVYTESLEKIACK